jgi:hypothetical protein
MALALEGAAMSHTDTPADAYIMPQVSSAT